MIQLSGAEGYSPEQVFRREADQRRGQVGAAIRELFEPPKPTKLP